MHNAGTMSAGLDLFVNAVDNEGGTLVAARDLFLWQKPQQSAASGNASAGRDLFLFAPVPDEYVPPQVSGRLFRAASDLYLLDAPDILSDHDTLRTQLLAGTLAGSGPRTDDYVNRDTLAAGRDLGVLRALFRRALARRDDDRLIRLRHLDATQQHHDDDDRKNDRDADANNLREELVDLIEEHALSMAESREVRCCYSAAASCPSPSCPAS